MKETIEYEIYIGCRDSQTLNEVAGLNELREMVVSYFDRNKVDFSVVNAEGGYLHKDGVFVMEDSLWITIIGDSDTDIMGLAERLAMFMNQESALVVRNRVKSRIM